MTASKLALGERSQVLVSNSNNEIDLPNEYGNQSEWATVLSLPIPAGNWVLSAHVGLAVGTPAPGAKIVCQMTQNGNVLSRGGTQDENLGLGIAFSGVDLLATTTTTGQVNISCADNAASVGAVARTLIAQRVGSIE